MHNPSNQPTAREESPRQWQTQPATGDVVGGARIDTLGALLLDAQKQTESSPSVYFKGVRVDYLNEGDTARFRVTSTYGSPVTELVPACELRVSLPVTDLGVIREFLEHSVRHMVPEVELVVQQQRARSAKASAEQRETESRNVWNSTKPLLQQ